MNREADVLTIRAPGPNRLFFAVWIVFSIIATVTAMATIDPDLFGFAQVVGIVTAGPPDHPRI